MSRAKHKPLALTIAGSDSSGGAGLQADLATFLALGVDGASVVTAITAQTPKKVLGIDPVKPTIVLKQLEAVFAGKKPKAAKSGMLLSAGVVECVADFFGGKNRPPLVVDPVMVSSSGAELLRSGGLRALKKKLLPLATVVTPNVPEAEVLAGMIIREPEDMRAAARALFKLRTPYNGLRLRTSDVLLADETRAELEIALPATVQTSSWTARFGAIYNNIQFSRTIIGFMLWLLVGVAAFNLIVSLIMIVRDKRGDIAILRTLGASPRMINRIFMWQGGLIGLIGISIGVVFGIIGSLQVGNLAEFVERRFAIQLLNAEVYPIDFLPSQLSFVDIALVVAGVLVLSLLATIYPARKAAAVQPAEALRTD